VKSGERLGLTKSSFRLARAVWERYGKRVTHASTDRLRSKSSKEQFSERFEREARAVAALNHPHICTLFDVGPNYLVMEYIEGKPIGGPLPPQEAVRLALQIADALGATHAKGINHRDLKPANILLTRSGIKVLDFGLAKQDQSKNAGLSEFPTMTTEAGLIVGTAAYMSPEQAQGKPVDHRSDIFAFGLVLYELLSGRRAFSGDTSITTLAAILHTEPAPLDAPVELARIVSRCLRKSPSDRFQSIAEVRTALEQLSARPDSTQPSIAVLPFANIGGDKENEYFSDGLAEDILNALTQLPGLRVIARASAFAFRGREHDIAEVGEKLKVGSVLHGSVRRSGQRIRVNVQRINVADNSQLWSERYDRELRDIFDIQDEIAQNIVEKLKVKLGTKAGHSLVKRYTDNLEAHSLYLKGNFHLYRFTAENMAKGRAYLEHAVALEPGYGPAWVQLADYHIARSFISVPLMEWPPAMKAAQKAVAADGELAEAHAALGFLDALTDYRWADALSRFETGLRQNLGSGRTHFWRAVVLHMMGRSDEASIAGQRAVELDPLSTLFGFVVATIYLDTGRYDRAAESARNTLDINPNFGMVMATLGEAYSRLGRHQEAIELLEKARHLMAGVYFVTGFLGGAYARAGRREDAERFLAELEQIRREQYVSAAAIALAALAVDDTENAFRWADQAVQDRDPNLLYAIRAQQFQLLAADARFKDLLRKVNLPS
jgi:eukaryotic-like serine/threonine-protein kinase